MILKRLSRYNYKSVNYFNILVLVSTDDIAVFILLSVFVIFTTVGKKK